MKKMNLAGIALVLAGCAHIPGAPNSAITKVGPGPASLEAPATATKGAKMIQVSEADPLGSLEQQIQGVRTEKVIIPTRLLRTLVANQKTASNSCKDLSLQLEALKNIDLEETGNGVEQQ
jgi:hypothetical protein